MRLSELLDSFARNNGIEKPVPDENKKYRIPAEDLVLFCFEQDRRLYLQAHLGPLSDSDVQRRDDTRRLLEHCLGLLKEHRSSVSVDRSAGLYILWQRLPLDRLDAMTFQETVERFGGCGLYCQGVLGGDSLPGSAGPVVAP